MGELSFKLDRFSPHQSLLFSYFFLLICSTFINWTEMRLACWFRCSILHISSPHLIPMLLSPHLTATTTFLRFIICNSGRQTWTALLVVCVCKGRVRAPYLLHNSLGHCSSCNYSALNRDSGICRVFIAFIFVQVVAIWTTLDCSIPLIHAQ